MELDDIFDYHEEVMLYALAAVALVAGVTKFVTPELWAGYEPQWMRSLLSFLPVQHMYIAGAVESAAGLLLVARYRVKEVASIVSLWLLGVTLTVASMGLWLIALRDLGLSVLAYGVASHQAE